MNPQLRNRIVLPLALLVGAIVGVGAIAFSFSRVLLAVSPNVATSAALALALNVVIVASLIAVAPTVRARRIRALVVASAVALIGAGVYAGQAGPWEGHHAEPHDEPGAAAASTTLRVAARDIAFEPTQLSAATGTVGFELVNEGQIVHTMVIEGVEGFKLAVNAAGDADSGSVSLEAGTYSYFCDVPGHRPAGMEGTLTVG